MTTYPGTTDLTILQGATFNPVLTALDSTGAAIDWTGYKARMQVLPNATDPNIIFALTTENSSVTVAGTPTDQGAIGIVISTTQVKLNLSAAATALLTFDQAAYDLELYFTPIGGGPDFVARPFQGTISLSPNVTR